jgi:inositol 1,4,5-triphosphate receptor type 1/inositol 1,4,5-triphosphate receptor type 3
MMQNTLVFFKKYFLHTEHIENNPQAYSLYLKKNNKKKKSGQKKEYH